MRRSEGWNKGQGRSGRIRKRRWGKRERVERGGWCPEGSFEFEWESPGESFLIASYGVYGVCGAEMWEARTRPSSTVPR